MKARAGVAVLILVCLLVASVPTQVQAYSTHRDVVTITKAEVPPTPAFVPLSATVDVTPTYGSWQQVDVSAHVPEGATGVILHYSGGTSTYEAGFIGFRKTGSTEICFLHANMAI